MCCCVESYAYNGGLFKTTFFVFLTAAARTGAVASGAAASESGDTFGQSAESFAGVLGEGSFE